MRRILLGVLIVLAALIALPPLVYTIFPPDAPELPAPGRRIEVGGSLAVNALDRGSGSPVVLVHGLPGSAYDWQPLVDAIAGRGARAIAYDRMGYARSDGRGDDDFTIDANARDLVGLLEAEDLRDVTLVGWSYGGPVSIQAAGRAPDRVGRLVLIGSAGPSEDDDEPPVPPAWLGPALIWVGAVPPLGRAIQEGASTEAFSDGPVPDWWLPQLAANFAAPHTRYTYRQEIMQLADSGELGLDAVSQPILLIHGDDDRLAPLATSEWLHRHAERSDLLVVEGGSHMLPITHTGFVADRILAFSDER